MIRPEKAARTTDEEQALFYLIFNQVEEGAALAGVSAEELDEIEQIGRMVSDVTGDPPQFLTST